MTRPFNSLRFPAFFLALFAAIFATSAFAAEWSKWVSYEDGNKGSLVSYRSKVEDGRIVVDASHREGFHTYAMDNATRENPGLSEPTAFKLQGGLRLSGEWKQPKVKDLSEPQYKLYDYGFEGRVQFSAPVERTSGDSVTLVISGQVCDVNGCKVFKDGSPDGDALRLNVPLPAAASTVSALSASTSAEAKSFNIESVSGKWSEAVAAPSAEDPKVFYSARYTNGSLEINVEHLPDWHTYALKGSTSGEFVPTVVSVTGALKVDPMSWTADQVPSMEDMSYHDVVKFLAPAEVLEGETARVGIEGQVCLTGGTCIPLQVSLLVSIPQGAKATNAKPHTVPDITTTGSSSETKQDLSRPSSTSWTKPSSPTFTDGKLAFRARYSEGRLEVEAASAEGYYVYAIHSEKLGSNEGMPIEITVDGPISVDGDWTEPEPKRVSVQYTETMTGVFFKHEGTVTFSAPVTLTGSGVVQLTISGQVCFADGCLDFFADGQKHKISFPVAEAIKSTTNGSSESTDNNDSVTETGADDEPPPSLVESALKKRQEKDPEGNEIQLILDEDSKTWVMPAWSPEKTVKNDKKEGWGAFIVACLLGGLVALLMPCVFPMIPITVSFFSKQAEERNGSTVSVALVYGFGLIFSYTALGFLLTAISDTGVTDFANNPYTASAVGLLFLVFGMSMLGAFELKLPSGLMQRFNMQGKSSGYMGSFLLGTTFAVTSMACTVPVVATILAFATQGQVLKPVIGMIIYSSVVAAPFVVLGLLPGLLKKMPRAGGWMNNVKIVFGFIEIAAAAEFFGWARLIPREIVLSVWIACALLSAAYLLKMFKAKYDAPDAKAGPYGMAFSVIFITSALWLAGGVAGKSLGFVESFLVHPVSSEYIQNPDIEDIVAMAKDKRQAIFIDVTSDP